MIPPLVKPTLITSGRTDFVDYLFWNLLRLAYYLRMSYGLFNIFSLVSA